MKKTLFVFFLFSIYCFGQTKNEWNNIKKIEVYKDSKQYTGSEKELKNLTFKSNVVCDDKRLIKILAKIEKPKIDILIEKSNLFFRITFQNKTETYLVYKKYGVLIKLTKERAFFWFKDKTEINNFIKKYKF